MSMHLKHNGRGAFRKHINFHNQPRGQMGGSLLVQCPVGEVVCLHQQSCQGKSPWSMSPSAHWSKKQRRVVSSLLGAGLYLTPWQWRACSRPGSALFPGSATSSPEIRASLSGMGGALCAAALLHRPSPLTAAGHSHVPTYRFYSSHVDKGYFSHMPNAWYLCICPDGWVATS